MDDVDPPRSESSHDVAQTAARRFWLVIGAVSAFVVFALIVSRLDSDPVSQESGATTLAVESLGDFSVAELDARGVAIRRVSDWLVVGEGRYVFFTVSPGASRLGRVRMLDRSVGRLVTVEDELEEIGPLHAASGGVVYESFVDGRHRLTSGAPEKEPVEMVSVEASTSRIDSVIVAPSGERVVYRELDTGLVQRLWSVTLAGDAVELVAGGTGGTIGAGIEAPIVVGSDGIVTYFADPEGDGDPQWFEVPIGGGQPTPTG